MLWKLIRILCLGCLSVCLYVSERLLTSNKQTSCLRCGERWSCQVPEEGPSWVHPTWEAWGASAVRCSININFFWSTFAFRFVFSVFTFRYSQPSLMPHSVIAHSPSISSESVMAHSLIAHSLHIFTICHIVNNFTCHVWAHVRVHVEAHLSPWVKWVSVTVTALLFLNLLSPVISNA